MIGDDSARKAKSATPTALDITRKRFLQWGMAGAALTALGPLATTGAARPGVKQRGAMAAAKQQAPNILFICTDQERADIPSAVPLPAHDKLGAEGVTFRNFHVHTSPCGPSRSTIYTGQHTQHTGIYVNPNSPPHPELSPDIPTIGHMLREQGYYTAYKGKWHLSNINDGKVFRGTPGGTYPNASDVLQPHGFSDYNFDGEKVGLTWEGFMEDGPIAADAAALLFRLKDHLEPGTPWFMAVNFVNPHDIMFYDATGRQRSTRLRPDWVAPLLGAPATPIYLEDLNLPLPRSFYEDDLSTKPEAQRAVRDGMAAFYGDMPLDDEAAWVRFQNYYFNCLRDVDQHVLWLLEALERSGQADNTVVIYTSDHGERAGAHGMRQKMGTMYKEDLQVPLLIRHPDVAGGASTAALGGAVDLVPTLLAFAGLDKGTVADRYPALKGVDLSPAVADTAAQTARDDAGILLNYATRYYWRHNGEMDLSKRRLFRGVHDGRYKFARYFAPAEHHMPTDWVTLTAHNDLELYDTAADPDELHNLAVKPQDHQDLILTLNTKINRLLTDEVGVDNGSEYPGPVAQYNTLSLSSSLLSDPFAKGAS